MKLLVVIFLAIMTNVLAKPTSQELQAQPQVPAARAAIEALIQESENNEIPPESESENDESGIPSNEGQGLPANPQPLEESQQILDGEGEGETANRPKRLFWPINNHHHYYGNYRNFRTYSYDRHYHSYCRHYHYHCYHGHCQNVCDRWGSYYD